MVNKELMTEYIKHIKLTIQKNNVLNKVNLLKEAINNLESLSPVSEFNKELSLTINSK